jgi:hypothetical protein
MRQLFILLLVWLAAPAAAQEPARPVLRMKLESQAAIPGQPIVLRIAVLAPTWLPEPPVFPSFEVPNVIVRLPEGASGPTSERVGGETWSGVARAYRLHPMTVGRFRIPPLPVTVTYADPETRKPITGRLLTEEITFEGKAPEGAEDLDPFIAAEALTLEQTIEGDPGKLAPGGAFTRTVTVRIKGTSPIFVPPLIPPFAAQGIVAYPKEPVVTETAARGFVSGERVETVTYVAEAGGTHSEPPIRLSWFNLAKKQVETAEAEGFEILSDGPPPAAPVVFDWRAALPWIFAAVLGVLVVSLAVVRLRPRIGAWHRRWHEAHLASEAYAFRQATAALRAREYGNALRAIALWSSRLAPASGVEEARLADALTSLGAALYGVSRRAPAKGQWAEAAAALGAARRARLAASAAHASGTLPPLNPGRIA